MTAEIVVMNREAIALAADSAVTTRIGNLDKVSTSANKLFALSPKNPAGIMIYGSARFMSLPWETIIKVYRETALPQNGFDTLKEYGEHFISFLRHSNIRCPEVAENNYVVGFVEALLENIKSEVLRQFESSMAESDNDYEVLSRLIQDVITQYLDAYRNEEDVIPLKVARAIMRKYRPAINKTIDDLFEGFEMPSHLRSMLRRVLPMAFARDFLADIYTGVVIAGFGEKELLPQICAYKIEGIIQYRDKSELRELLKYQQDIERSCSGDEMQSAVIPYAQGDMASRFMNGIDPLYELAEQSFLEGLCQDFTNKVVANLRKYNDAQKANIKRKIGNYSAQLIQEYFKNMSAFAEQYFSDPTVEAISWISKNELAALAEALVHLTSLKRKVSRELETVSEPIDVALISKGDGFIWIKRKQYFKAESNPQFFFKRFKGVVNESQTKAKDNGS